MKGKLKQARTDKAIITLYHFYDEIYVHCPACKEKALVSASPKPYTYRSQFSFMCSSCGKQLVHEDEWFGAVLLVPRHKRCSFCGTVINESRESKKRRQSMKVKCTGCEKIDIVPVRNYRIKTANPFGITDPHFGLPLWYQQGIGENILWAYNQAHINYLRQYVSAKLRESIIKSTRSMPQNLPRFIMKAGSRERILKALDKLEKV